MSPGLWTWFVHQHLFSPLLPASGSPAAALASDSCQALQGVPLVATVMQLKQAVGIGTGVVPSQQAQLV